MDVNASFPKQEQVWKIKGRQHTERPLCVSCDGSGSRSQPSASQSPDLSFVIILPDAGFCVQRKYSDICVIIAGL